MNESREPQSPIRRLAIAVVSLGMIILCVIFSLQSVSPKARLLSILPMLILLFTFIVLAVTWPRWLWSFPACAACNRTQRWADRNLPSCPACGANWKVPKGLKNATKSQRRWIGVAVVMVLLIVFRTSRWWLPEDAGARTAAKVVSSDDLIDTMLRGGFSEEDLLTATWGELQTRTLTEAQLLRLAEGLAATPAQQRYRNAILLWPQKERWLNELLESRRLPREFVASYWQSRYSLSLRIIVPARVEVGRDLTVQACFDWPGREKKRVTSHNQSLAFYCSGFSFQGRDEQLGRQDKVLGYFDVNCSEVDENQIMPEVPTVTLTAERGGTMPITFTCWAVLAKDWLVSQPIRWKEDGTPLVPEDVIWNERMEASGTVEITAPIADSSSDR